MRVTYIITNIKNCGPYQVVDELIKNSDFDVTIISLFGRDDQNLIKQLKKQKIEVINLKLNKITYFIKGKTSLKKVIQKDSIIHSHGFLPDVISSKMQNKKVTTIHNNMKEDYINQFGKIKGKILILIHKKIIKKFDKIICCSQSIYETMKKDYQNITYIRNGISPELRKKQIRNKIRNQYKVKETDIIYLFAGNLNDGKNVIPLIELFKKNRKSNEKLWILGNGPKLDECKKLENKFITVFGYRKDVKQFMMASDIYCSNSKSEGFSISILQAVMLGNKLLLSNIPSHVEMINLDPNIGEIYNYQNFKQKKQQVINKLKNKTKIKKIISSNNMVEKYKKEYEVLL